MSGFHEAFIKLETTAFIEWNIEIFRGDFISMPYHYFVLYVSVTEVHKDWIKDEF